MQVRVVRLLCRATLLFFLVWAWPAHGADLPNTKGWIELHTQNFSVFSNASSGKTQKLATDLERFREVLGLITKGFDLEASVPTSVFVFKNGASMLPYKLDASGKPMNVAGYFMERPFRNYILLDASAESSQSRVIYHEYVHSMLHETFGHIPQWLNEGLAEYYSTFRFNNLSNTAWVGDPIDSHVYQLRRNALMGLDRLFSITTRSPEYNEATMQGTFYAQAWMLVHYLVATDERRSAFGSFLTRIRNGETAEQALQATLNMDLDALEIGLKQYMAQGGSGNFRISLADDVERVKPTAAPMEKAYVPLRLGELLAHRGPGHGEFARRHLEAAIEQGAPTDQAYGMLGVVADYADDDEGAESWYRKSLEQNPDDAVVLTRLARLVLYGKNGESASGPDASGLPAQVVEARGLFQRALKLDGSNVEALAGMGRTYLWEQGDVEMGLRLLAGAATLRPDRLDIVADLVQLFARSGRRQAAWTVVEQQLRRDSTDPRILAAAEQWIVRAEIHAADEKMRADDTAGALAILDTALQRVHDPEQRGELERHRAELQTGRPRELQLVTTEEQEQTVRLIERYNEAVNLMNAGEAERALAILEAELTDCGPSENCDRLREFREQVSSWIERSRRIERFNEAVALLQAGKRKAAIAILQELEGEAADEELQQRARDLLDELGAR